MAVFIGLQPVSAEKQAFTEAPCRGGRQLLCGIVRPRIPATAVVSGPFFGNALVTISM